MTTGPGDHLRVLSVAGDAASAAGIIGTFAGILPPLAALVAVCWYLIQIWESDTVQAWFYRRAVLRRFRKRHYRRVLARWKDPVTVAPPKHNSPFGNE